MRFVGILLGSMLILSFMSLCVANAQPYYHIGVGIQGYSLECLRNNQFNLTVYYVVENSESSNRFECILSFEIVDQTDIQGKRIQDAKWARTGVILNPRSTLEDRFSTTLSPNFFRAKFTFGIYIAALGSTERSIVICRDNFLFENWEDSAYRSEFAINWRYETSQLKYNFTYCYVFVNPLNITLQVPIKKGFLSPDFSDFGGVEKSSLRLSSGEILLGSKNGSAIENPDMLIKIPPLSNIKLILEVEPKEHPISKARASEGVLSVNITSRLRVRGPLVFKHVLPFSFEVAIEDFKMWGMCVTDRASVFFRNVWQETDVVGIGFYPLKPRTLYLREWVVLSSVFPEVDDLSITINETLAAPNVYGVYFPVVIDVPLPPSSNIVSVSDGKGVCALNTTSRSDIELPSGQYSVSYTSDTTLIKIKARPHVVSSNIEFRTIIGFRVTPQVRAVPVVEVRYGFFTFHLEDRILNYTRVFLRNPENVYLEFTLPDGVDVSKTECSPPDVRGGSSNQGKRIIFWDMPNHNSLRDQYLLPMNVQSITNAFGAGVFVLAFYLVVGVLLILVDVKGQRILDSKERVARALPGELVVIAALLSSYIFSTSNFWFLLSHSDKICAIFWMDVLILAIIVVIHVVLVFRKQRESKAKEEARAQIGKPKKKRTRTGRE